MTSTATSSQELSSDNVTPKSPLEFPWTFWYLKPDKRTSWEKSLVKLIDVAFVEDFWATFNHLATPAKLAANRSNSDYFFFKKGSKTLRSTVRKGRQPMPVAHLTMAMAWVWRSEFMFWNVSWGYEGFYTEVASANEDWNRDSSGVHVWT